MNNIIEKSKWSFTESEPRIAYRYARNDSDRPTIIVVHGGPGDNNSYLISCCADHLEALYNVVWFDQRGCGNSDRRLTINEFNPSYGVQDICRLQKELSLDNVIIMGHSWGGMLAGMYASQYPKNVKALINVCGPGSFLDLQNILLERLVVISEDNSAQHDRLKKILLMGYGSRRLLSLLQMAREKGLYYKDFDFTKKEMEANIRLAVQDGYYDEKTILESEESLFFACDYHSLTTFDIYKQLSCVTCPSLVIGGKYDGVVSEDCIEKYHRAIPSSKMAIIQGAGHNPFQEAPEEFFRIINNFICHEI